jgi:hypothetical protein
MDFLDSVLPVYVDYLGRYESEPGYVEGAPDVMRELLERGVQDHKRFLPNAELTVDRGKIFIKDENQVGNENSLEFNVLDVNTTVWCHLKEDN